jgi:hypothetical protein
VDRNEPYLRDHDFTLAECLRAKVHDDPDHRMGFWQFVTTTYLPALGIAPKSNARLAGIFGWLAEAVSWRVYRGDYFDPALGSRRQPSERAIICVRPVGGDELLADEVIPLPEHPNLTEAYRVIEELHANGVPQQKISADAFECAIVDEFGSMLAAP